MPDIASSAIRHAEHDGSGRMTVTFASGRTYVYAGVPVSLYGDFLACQSKGQFFNREIRDRFRAVEITGRRRGRAPRSPA